MIKALGVCGIVLIVEVTAYLVFGLITLFIEMFKRFR